MKKEKIVSASAGAKKICPRCMKRHVYGTRTICPPCRALSRFNPDLLRFWPTWGLDLYQRQLDKCRPPAGHQLVTWQRRHFT